MLEIVRLVLVLQLQHAHRVSIGIRRLVVALDTVHQQQRPTTIVPQNTEQVGILWMRQVAHVLTLK